MGAFVQRKNTFSDILKDAVEFSRHIKGIQQKASVAIETIEETDNETSTFNFRATKHEKANAQVLLKGITIIKKVGIGVISWDQLIASLKVCLLRRCFWFIEKKNFIFATF